MSRAIRAVRSPRAAADFGRTPWAELALALLILFGSLGLWGCAPEMAYVWVKDVQIPVPAPNAVYQIKPGDTLAVRVYNDDKMSSVVKVRPDGYVTVILLGDVLAAGKSPPALSNEIQAALAKYLNAPTVSVTLEGQEEIKIAMLGEVGDPGIVTLPKSSGVLQALAAAGGLNDYADEERIFVLRQNPRIRVRFVYDDLVANEPQSVGFVLLDGDVIMVE